MDLCCSHSVIRRVNIRVISYRENKRDLLTTKRRRELIQEKKMHDPSGGASVMQTVRGFRMFKSKMKCTVCWRSR